MKKSVMNIAAILVALFGLGFGIGCLISLVSSKGALKDGEYAVTVCETTDIHGAYFDSTYVDGVAAKTSLANVASYLKELRGSGVQPVLIDAGDNKTVVGKSVWGIGHSAQLEDYYTCLAEGRKFWIDGRSAFPALSLVLSIVRSSEEGKWVELYKA